MIAKPFENCYWVIPGKFLAGECPGGIDEQDALIKVESLARIGVSTIIDLTEEGEGLNPYAHLLENQDFGYMRHLRFPAHPY